MLRKMVIPGERIEEEEEESEDTDDADTAPMGGEPSAGILEPDFTVLSSPAHTRSYRKAKKEKDSKPFYRGYKGEGVVYLPRYINGLTKKSFAAEFFAGNTTVRNELVHVLGALVRLKQLTRKEYTNITARLATSL